jgi:peroxiredoxin
MGQIVSIQARRLRAKAGSIRVVRLGDTIPDLEVETTTGKFKLQEWVGDDWAIIFSYPGEDPGVTPQDCF